MSKVKAPILDRRRSSFFKETYDDWHPSYKIEGPDARYPGGYVCVSLHRNFTFEGGLHRVSVWGQDDTGMDRDFDFLPDAEALYIRLAMNPEQLTKNWLLSIGFNWF